VVLQIIEQLQPFDWSIGEVDEYEQRAIKPIQVLENGAMYQGEWLVATQ